MATRRHAVVLLVLCAVLWSTGGILIKWLPGSAFALAGVRSAIAAVVLLLALREWPGRWSWWLGSGALAGAASMLGFVVATKLTTAANAIFLVYTAPLYVALLSPWVLHEPIRRGDWLTLLLALLGLGCFCVEQLTFRGGLGICVPWEVGWPRRGSWCAYARPRRRRCPSSCSPISWWPSRGSRSWMWPRLLPCTGGSSSSRAWGDSGSRPSSTARRSRTYGPSRRS